MEKRKEKKKLNLIVEFRFQTKKKTANGSCLAHPNPVNDDMAQSKKKKPCYSKWVDRPRCSRSLQIKTSVYQIQSNQNLGVVDLIKSK